MKNQFFFRAEILSVNTWRSGPDICSLICGFSNQFQNSKVWIFMTFFCKNQGSRKYMRTLSFHRLGLILKKHFDQINNGIQSFGIDCWIPWSLGSFSNYVDKVGHKSTKLDLFSLLTCSIKRTYVIFFWNLLCEKKEM